MGLGRALTTRSWVVFLLGPVQRCRLESTKWQVAFGYGIPYEHFSVQNDPVIFAHESTFHMSKENILVDSLVEGHIDIRRQTTRTDMFAIQIRVIFPLSAHISQQFAM